MVSNALSFDNIPDLFSTENWFLMPLYPIDNNGFAQSFTTAYVPTNSVLRLVNGVLQAVPDPHVV